MKRYIKLFDSSASSIYWRFPILCWSHGLVRGCTFLHIIDGISKTVAELNSSKETILHFVSNESGLLSKEKYDETIFESVAGRQ